MNGGNEMMMFDIACRMRLPLTVNQVKGIGNTICLAIANPRRWPGLLFLVPFIVSPFV